MQLIFHSHLTRANSPTCVLLYYRLNKLNCLTNKYLLLLECFIKMTLLIAVECESYRYDNIHNIL